MTVISLPWNLHLALTAGNWCQQVTSVVRRLLVRQALCLHHKRCVCICMLRKLNCTSCTAIMCLGAGLLYFCAHACYGIWLHHHITLKLEYGTLISCRLCKHKTCKHNLIVNECTNTYCVEYLNSSREIYVIIASPVEMLLKLLLVGLFEI